MRCPHCGFEDPEDFVFCSECGRPRRSAPPPGVHPDPEHGISGPPGAPPRPAPAAAPGQVSGGPRPAGAGHARLVGLEGPVEGREFALDRPEVGIGRRSECDIPVPDQSVSRLHARIRRVPTGYLIEDAGSANGTWVNGVRLTGVQPLVERDVVRIGNAAFTFHGAEPTAAVPPGAMTMVADLGDEPSPFGGEVGPDEAAPPLRAAVAPPLPVPPPRPVQSPAPVAPPATPSSAGDSLAEVRAALGELEHDLGPFIERLNLLATSVSALEGRLADVEPQTGPSPAPPALRRLMAGLEAEGGVGRYRELLQLLDTLRSRPTDPELLRRLQGELPAIVRLIEVHLKALEQR